MNYKSCGLIDPILISAALDVDTSQGNTLLEGSPTVAKSRTLLLKSYLKSMKSLDLQNLKSRKLVWKLVNLINLCFQSC